MKRHNNIITGCIAALLFLITPLTFAVTPTLKAYQAAAEKVVDGLTARDPSAFNRTIDADSILERVFDGLLVDPEWKQGFRRGLKSAITTKLGDKLISRIPEGAYAKLLRVKRKGNEGRALVRLDYGDSGSGYMDMHLVQRNDGSVRLVDWYDYSTGQLYSQSLRQAVATLSPTPTVLGKVFDIASNRKASADVLAKFIELNNKQQLEETVRYFLSLDEEFRKLRLLNLIAFQAASQMDDMDLYRKVLANIEHYYGDDETLAFVLLDYYYLDGKYDKVLKSADKLQSAFGVDDANLTVIKANTLIEQGKYKAADNQARRAIKLEPDFEYGYWSLITAQLEQKQHSQAVETAKILEQKFGYDMGPSSLGDNKVYTDLLQSAEYRKWRNAK